MSKILTRADLQKGETEGLFRKAGASEVEIGPDRTARFVVSTDAVDRDNDVVDQKGWQLESYKRNPVVLWAHDYSALPVGKATEIAVSGGRLVATAQFAEHPFAETVFQLVKGGFLRATSVGFAPKAYKINDERDGVDFKEQELLEFSIVPVPANPEALIEARAAGVDLAPIKAWAEGVIKGLDIHDVVDDDEDGDPVRWNRALSKAFDVDEEPVEAHTLEYKWVSRFLGVPVKDLYETSVNVPSPRMGTVLSALDEKLGAYKADGLRNLKRDGTEVPPEFETIQLNSRTSRSFLVSGIRFLSAHLPTDGPSKMAVKAAPSWSGITLTFYVGAKAGDAVVRLIAETYERAKQYKFLKGEAFSLSGEFLPRGATEWSDVFLAPVNMVPLKRATALLVEQGETMDPRGVILMGPPGTGKTLVARAMMTEAKDATYIWVSSRDFGRVGTFGGIELAFDLARENAPAVVLMEDIDNWWDGYSIDLLKTELDGLKQQKGIITLLTTNFPESLPEALIDRPGRFHDVLHLDLPSEATRREMLAKWAPGASAKVLDQLAKDTIQLSGAHLRELVRFAEVMVTQDSLELDAALVRALEKVKEQRDLISQVQAGNMRRPRKMVGKGAMAETTRTTKGGAGHCDRCHGEGELAAGVCGKCAAELQGWTNEATLARTATLTAALESLGEKIAALEAKLAPAQKAEPMDDQTCCNCSAKAGMRCAECAHGMCTGCAKNANCPHCYKAEKAFVFELIDGDDGAAVLELEEVDKDVVDFSPEDLREALRGVIAGELGNLVRSETEAALNRARGRVD